MTDPFRDRARRALGRAKRRARLAVSDLAALLRPSAAADTLPRDLDAEVRRLATGYRAPEEIAECDRRLTQRGLRGAEQRGVLARAAAKVGALELASGIAHDAIAHGSPSSDAIEVRDRAVDRLDILAQGWPRAVPDAEPYEPSSTAVLSVLSQSLPIRTGGYATRSHGLITSLVGRGWDVEVLTRLGFPYDRWAAGDVREVADRDEVDGLVYRRSLVPGRRSYPQVPLASYLEESAQHIAAAAVDHRAGLIHASSFYATGLPAADAAARLGIPFIYEMRGSEDLMRSAAYAGYPESSDGRFLIEAENEVCRRADHVFVITDAMRDEMVRRGIPRGKLTVVPNGVHVANFQPMAPDKTLATELGIAGRVVIGYLGGFPHYEGLKLLVRAAAILEKRLDDFVVLMVGDGQQDGSLRQETAELGLRDRVIFTGRVPHHEIPRYLSLVDITPFPRLPLQVCELISPMKPYEAMAMGKSVVVSDVAALTQIVQDGVTGLAFAKGDAEGLADALERLVRDPALRARLGSAARHWVQKHGDWSKIAERVDEVYRTFIAGPPVAR